MTFTGVRDRVAAAHWNQHCVGRTRVDTSARLGAGQYVNVAAGTEQTQVAYTRHCNTFDTRHSYMKMTLWMKKVYKDG